MSAGVRVRSPHTTVTVNGSWDAWTSRDACVADDVVRLVMSQVMALTPGPRVPARATTDYLVASSRASVLGPRGRTETPSSGLRQLTAACRVHLLDRASGVGRRPA